MDVNEDILNELLAAGLIQQEDYEKRTTFGFENPLNPSHASYSTEIYPDFSNPTAAEQPSLSIEPASPTTQPFPKITFPAPQPSWTTEMSKRSYTDANLSSSSDKVSKMAKTTESTTSASSVSMEGCTFPALANLANREASAFSNESEVQSWFAEVANKLLNESVLHINDVPHRFIEIEFYYKGGVHMDHFTHGDEMQKTHGHWYFHRQGKTFRNGTYKGLDFTIGNSKVFGGVLIRAVENLTEGTLIEGPSLVVDHILNLNDVGSIDELVQGFTVSALTKSKQLYISDIASSPTSVAHKYSAEKVYTCPRVGLTLKKNDNNQAKFIMRHYRFFLRPSKLKKGKVNIVLSLIHDGLSVDKIFQISASPKKSIEKYMDMYEKGKSKNPAEFYGQALNTDDMCYLYGACVGSDE